MPEAGDEVIVHHPHRLHERVADGRTDEAESALEERLAHAVRFFGARRKLSQRPARILLGDAADEAPEEAVERPFLLAELEERLRVLDRGLDLLPVADDARILQRALDPARRVARHLLGVEAIEHLEEARPLVED